MARSDLLIFPKDRDHKAHLERWYGHRCIQADQCREVKGLKQFADAVSLGGLSPSAPVFYAYRHEDAPYPDVVVGLVIDDQIVDEFKRGHRETVLGLLDALEDAYEQFAERVKRGDPD